MKSLAIVVLSYNHPQLTESCLQSVLQVAPQRIPIYLYHNGSEVKHVQQLQKNFSENVHHIVSAENHGFSGGMNRAMAHAFQQHEWLLAITNDCELLRWGNVLGLQKPAMVAPLVYRKNKVDVDSVGAVIDPVHGKLRHLKKLSEVVQHINTDCFYIPGTVFFLHKEVFESLQGFDESLHTYWEDVDFSRRMRLQSYKPTVLWDFQFLHKVGKTCHKKPFYTNYLFHRNGWIVTRRWGRELLSNQQKIRREFYFLKKMLLRIFILLRHNRWADVGSLLRAYFQAWQRR